MFSGVILLCNLAVYTRKISPFVVPALSILLLLFTSLPLEIGTSSEGVVVYTWVH
jgi:hypothetical protein